MSRDLFYINYTVVRSDYRRLVCHDVVSLVIYYFLGREVGLPTVGIPRCREICSIFIYTVVRSDYRRLVCHDVVRSGLPDGI